MSHEAAGAAFASALFGRLSDPMCTAGGTQGLYAAVISCEGSPLTLGPDDAGAHPLIGPWASPNLGEAIGRIFWAGAVRANIAPNTPYVTGVSVETADGGALVSGAHFRFSTTKGAADVSFIFGSPVQQSKQRNTRFISGDALIDIGIRAAELTARAEPFATAMADRPASSISSAVH